MWRCLSHGVVSGRVVEHVIVIVSATGFVAFVLCPRVEYATGLPVAWRCAQ